jgi:hypothetical protein
MHEHNNGGHQKTVRPAGFPGVSVRAGFVPATRKSLFDLKIARHYKDRAFQNNNRFNHKL